MLAGPEAELDGDRGDRQVGGGEHDLGRRERALAAAGRRLTKVPATLRRGQVSFHHCRTIHGSGPNRSGQPRRSLAVHLQPDDNRFESAAPAAGHRNDDLCRRTATGEPDYTDPELFPRLWPRVR